MSFHPRKCAPTATRIANPSVCPSSQQVTAAPIPTVQPGYPTVTPGYGVTAATFTPQMYQPRPGVTVVGMAPGAFMFLFRGESGLLRGQMRHQAEGQAGPRRAA
jgi:hypothetical protein